MVKHLLHIILGLLSLSLTAQETKLHLNQLERKGALDGEVMQWDSGEWQPGEETQGLQSVTDNGSSTNNNIGIGSKILIKSSGWYHQDAINAGVQFNTDASNRLVWRINRNNFGGDNNINRLWALEIQADNDLNFSPDSVSRLLYNDTEVEVVGHDHNETDITDLDKYTQGEADGRFATIMANNLPISDVLGSGVDLDSYNRFSGFLEYNSSAANIPTINGGSLISSARSTTAGGQIAIGHDLIDDAWYRNNNATWHQIASRDWVTAQGYAPSSIDLQYVTDNGVATSNMIQAAAVFPTHSTDISDGDNLVGYTSVPHGISSWIVNVTDSNFPTVNGALWQFARQNVNSLSQRNMQLFSSTDFDEWYLRKIRNENTNGWMRIWHDGNHGPGSGLHADSLDGHEGSYYLDYGNLTGTLWQETLGYLRPASQTPVVLGTGADVAHFNVYSTSGSAVYAESDVSEVLDINSNSVSAWATFENNNGDNMQIGVTGPYNTIKTSGRFLMDIGTTGSVISVNENAITGAFAILEDQLYSGNYVDSTNFQGEPGTMTYWENGYLKSSPVGSGAVQVFSSSTTASLDIQTYIYKGSSSVNLTLPTGSDAKGKTYYVITDDNGVVNLHPDGSVDINNSSFVTLDSNDEPHVMVVFDGSEYYTIPKI